MKYFIIRNYGYDGIGIENVGQDKEKAETIFKFQLKEKEKYHEEYPNTFWDKGIILIEGTIIKEDNKSEIFGINETP